MSHTEIPDRGRGQTSSPKKTSSSRPGFGGSSTNKKGVNTSTYTSKSSNTSKSSKDISKEIDKAMSDRQDQRNQQDQGIMAKIGLGDIEKGYIGDDAFKETVPAGQHKLRTQYDRLLAKYGDDFAGTSQAKVLANYLSGVQQEKGGGLGAKDTDYGGGEISKYDQAGNFITKAKQAEAEAYRQQQLGIMGLNPNQPFPFQSQGFNKDTFDFELARKGLSPEQYQNYIRQMIAADPREGNTFGKENFGSPFADFMGKAMQFAPGIGALSRVLPKGDPTESQVYGQGDNKTFYDTSMPREDRSGIMGTQMAQQTGTTDPGYDMSIYGSRIGQEGPFTADFVDQDGDGSDDRYQSGPGQGGSGAIPKENFIGKPGIDNMGLVGGIPGISQPIRQISANTPANAMAAFNQAQPMSTQQLSFGVPQQQLSFAPQQPLSQAPQGLAQFSSMLNRFS